MNWDARCEGVRITCSTSDTRRVVLLLNDTNSHHNTVIKRWRHAIGQNEHPTKYRDELRCSRKVRMSRSTSDTRHVIFTTKEMIAIFPLWTSMLQNPAAPTYEVNISQLIQLSRACGFYHDSLCRGLLITRNSAKVSNQWTNQVNREATEPRVLNG